MMNIKKIELEKPYVLRKIIIYSVLIVGFLYHGHGVYQKKSLIPFFNFDTSLDGVVVSADKTKKIDGEEITLFKKGDIFVAFEQDGNRHHFSTLIELGQARQKIDRSRSWTLHFSRDGQDIWCC